MKVSRETCAENRERIVEVAGKLFRERGFDGIGVADIMNAAGLTHGGFYGHFESKDALAAEASRAALARSAANWDKVVESTPDRPLRVLLERYLSGRHRDDPGRGCMFAALAADAARRDGAVRSIFTEGLRRFVDILARVAPGASRGARRRRALSSMSEMVGALILARAVDDPALSEEILAASARNLTALAPVAAAGRRRAGRDAPRTARSSGAVLT
jgi:TetR/AcrR family transcriptional repressor of nem operon